MLIKTNVAVFFKFLFVLNIVLILIIHDEDCTVQVMQLGGRFKLSFSSRYSRCLMYKEG